MSFQHKASCSDCAHCSQGWCSRSIGRHFSAGINGYRSRLNVSCASERASERTLTRRWKCGPSARYFEPKGSDLPLKGKSGFTIADGRVNIAHVRVTNLPSACMHDTIADSDGDDGA